MRRAYLIGWTPQLVWAPVWNPYIGWTWMWIQVWSPVWQIVDGPRELPAEIKSILDGTSANTNTVVDYL